MLSRRKCAVLIMEYGAVLLGFCLMYLFMIPQSDVFLFARDVDGTFLNALQYSLHYGNGRLLGNLIGVFFSAHFAWSWLVVAGFLTALVVLMNAILFDSSPAFVFPTALLAAVPSVGLIRQCYYLFAGFCNYVIPIVFLLVSVWVYKSFLEGKPGSRLSRVCLVALDGVCAIASCLFSENTTIVIVMIALGMLLYPDSRAKQAACFRWTHLLWVMMGVLIMIGIPVVTRTGEKMDSYRQVASGLSAIKEQFRESFRVFADVFNHFYVLLVLFSLAMVLLCLRRAGGAPWIKRLQVTLFSVYPVVCFLMNQLDTHSFMAKLQWTKSIDAFLALVYICNILLAVALVEDKTRRLRCLLMVLVTAASIGPMMIVSVSGHRTYYTTFICMMIFSVALIREYLPDFLREIGSTSVFQKYVAVGAAACFAVVTLMFFTTSLYNYNFYVIRSNDMAEKIAAGEIVSVPTLPYDSIGLEMDWDPILYYAFEHVPQQHVIALIGWEHFGEYQDSIRDVRHAVSYAFEHWQYKDPLYPQSLCSG